jgi:hypothetical protein
LDPQSSSIGAIAAQFMMKPHVKVSVCRTVPPSGLVDQVCPG